MSEISRQGSRPDEKLKGLLQENRGRLKLRVKDYDLRLGNAAEKLTTYEANWLKQAVGQLTEEQLKNKDLVKDALSKSLKTGELAKTNAEFSTTKLTRIIPIIVELLMDQGADAEEEVEEAGSGVAEQTTPVETDAEKPSRRSRLRSTVRDAFATGKNVLVAVGKLVKRPFQTPEKIEVDEHGVADKPARIEDLPEVDKAYIDPNEEPAENDQKHPKMQRAWDALARVKNKLATKGKDAVSGIKEKKEERSLEYRVRDAISKIIRFDLEMVEAESTFEEVLLWKEDDGAQQNTFKQVLANLGIPRLDFDITATATVADLILAIKTQYPKLSVRERIEERMIDSYERSVAEGGGQ